jgi:hypothetical protein
MSVTVAPTNSDVLTALRSFVLGIVGQNIPVVRGLSNRVAMPPPKPGFVVIQPLFQSRLRWNIDDWDMAGSNPTSGTSEQGIELRVQIDCYGPSSPNWAAMISTLFRDNYGCQALAPNCQPLYADEARMVPLVDAEEQYEERWMVDARLQWNPVTTVAQDFAGSVAGVNLINVPEAYA